MAIFRSSLAPLVLVALTQGDGGVTLRALARACRTRDSSVQRALDFLLEEGIVERRKTDEGVSYALVPHPLQAEILSLAFNDPPREDIVATLCLANPAVEFAGVDGDGLLVVFRQQSTALERLRLAHALERLRTPVALTSFQHDALVEQLHERPALRERAARARILRGTIARSFPDRRRHSDPRHARALHRPHPSLHVPSQRTLRRLAARFQVDEIDLFGSAVRSDFRPDSDLDVLVQPGPHVRLRVSELVALEDELERLFDRDVDLFTPDALDERFRPRVEREAVALYG